MAHLTHTCTPVLRRTDHFKLRDLLWMDGAHLYKIHSGRPPLASQVGCDQEQVSKSLSAQQVSPTRTLSPRALSHDLRVLTWCRVHQTPPPSEARPGQACSTWSPSCLCLAPVSQTQDGTTLLNLLATVVSVALSDIRGWMEHLELWDIEQAQAVS